MLVANDNYLDPALNASIHDRVWKDSQRKDTATLCDGCAKVRMRNQQRGNSFELAEKSLCHQRSSLLRVEVQGIYDVPFRAGMKPKRHRTSLERRRSIASFAGTLLAEPDAKEASLRSASISQAFSTSGSASRLAMRRSSRCERSAEVSFRASASKTSRLGDMMISDAISANRW